MNITDEQRATLEDALDKLVMGAVKTNTVLNPDDEPLLAAYLKAIAIVRELPPGSGRRVRSDAHLPRPRRQLSLLG